MKHAWLWLYYWQWMPDRLYRWAFWNLRSKLGCWLAKKRGWTIRFKQEKHGVFYWSAVRNGWHANESTFRWKELWSKDA